MKVTYKYLNNLYTMKKNIVFCLFTIISLNMFSQVYHLKNKYDNIPREILSNIDKMGIDDSLYLTELEGKFLNAIAGISEKDFNFSKSKVAFFEGNVGSLRSDKKDYFAMLREWLNARTDSTIYYFGALYLFNNAQKKESGGYDAAIVSGSKKLLSIKEVLKQLKKKR